MEEGPDPKLPEALPSPDISRAEIETMKREIDGLQIIATNIKKPWYRDISTLISVLALVFSFGTTVVSLHRAQLQDIQAARQELRVLLLRISAIPRENLEAQKKYADDASARQAISQLYNAENTMLVRQAAETAKALPKGKVSATEYYEIGTAMVNAYDFVDALQFFELARNSANGFNDDIGATRSIASVSFILGKVSDGRTAYQQALEIFSKYPGFSQDVKDSTNAFTEITWSGSEAGIGEFALALSHLDRAQAIVQDKRVGFDQVKAQITAQRQLVNAGVPPKNSQTPIGGLVPAQ
jgi:tetratricopeptide (TPR) repeat protein